MFLLISVARSPHGTAREGISFTTPDRPMSAAPTGINGVCMQRNMHSNNMLDRLIYWHTINATLKNKRAQTDFLSAFNTSNVHLYYANAPTYLPTVRATV